MKRQAVIMKNKPEKLGMTLVEMLLAVVILLMLISITVTVGRRIEQQSEERLTRETLALIDTALGQFSDFGYQYKDQKYKDLKFPLDCNDFTVNEIETALKEALGYISAPPVSLSSDVNDSENRNYSGCEVMYFMLNMVPASRAVLDQLEQSLILRTGTINEDTDEEKPLMRIVDSWGTTLNYSYYDNETEDQPLANELKEPPIDEPRPFPIITSAGQDKEFGTDDDITNR